MIITNSSQIKFSYELPDGIVLTETKQSNTVQTDILTYSFSKIKSSSKTFVQEGEQAIQTVVLLNNSLFTISNIFFTDNLSSGASIVPQSVIVNGVEQPTFDAVTGFNIGDLAPNESATISYVIDANNPLTEVLVDNFATVNYNADARNFEENTNTVEVVIVSNRISIIKEVDKNVAVKGEQLHYTSTIKNTGTLLKTNLFFTDSIPNGTTFVDGSVKIDGVNQPSLNPETGFALANLGVGLTTIVEFDVVVN